jgi:hypothetical protein
MCAVYLKFISVLLILEMELQVSRLPSDSGHTGPYKPREAVAYTHRQTAEGSTSISRSCLSHADRDLYDIMWRIPHCLDNRLTDDGEVVSLTRWPRSVSHKHCFSASGARLC